MNMQNFLNAVTVNNSEFHKEKLEYKYYDDKGKEKTDHVFVAVRKRAPAALLDSAKGFGMIDPYTWVAGMVFLLGDDGDTTTLTADQVRGMDALTFAGLTELINKHHAKTKEVDAGKD